MGGKWFDVTGAALAAAMIFGGPAFAARTSQGQAQSSTAGWKAARASGGAALVGSRPAGKLTAKAKEMVDEMIDSILNYKHKGSKEKGDTPPLELMPMQSTVKLRVPKGHKPDFENYTAAGKHTIYNVSGVGKDGIVPFFALMPASGHVNETVAGKYLTKNDTARYYAKTNVYNIEVEHPDGRIEYIDGIKAGGALVKAHELNIKLTAGSTFVRFYPTATGIGGYYNGRVVELRWDGTSK